MQAMKMNSTFCVSSIPNHIRVSGISAAIGTLRPNSANGAPPASNRRQLPARTPSGTPTTMASPKPIRTRRIEAAMLAIRLRSLSSAGKLVTTSTGLGSTAGDTIRSSATLPEVTNHHSSSTTPIVKTPASARRGCGVTCRSSITNAYLARPIYFVPAASAG
jgi:hypothetical protein